MIRKGKGKIANLFTVRVLSNGLVITEGTIYLVRKQNFLKNYYFLPPGTRTRVRMSGGKKCSFF